MQEPKSSARPLCSCQQRMTKSFRTATASVSQKVAWCNAGASFGFINVRRAENLVLCSFFRNKSQFQVPVAGPDKPPFAHFTASVFIGSTFSHFKQRRSVLPVRSVIARAFCTSGNAVHSWLSPVSDGKIRSRKPKGKCPLSLKGHL